MHTRLPAHDSVSRPRLSSLAGTRAFTLLAVLIIGIIVAAGAAGLVLSARESAHAASDDGRSAQAWGVAMAGLTWAQGHLNDNSGKAALSAAAGGTTTLAAGMNLHPFDPNDAFAGIAVGPPASGQSNANWQAFDKGHFGLIGARDPLSESSIVVRSVGRVGGAQVVLETNLTMNILKSLPAALTACFSGDQQVIFADEESPYDYYGNMRFDGNGGLPIGMSADHNRFNGLTRLSHNSGAAPPDRTPSDPIAGYPSGLRWRGTQSLRLLGSTSGTFPASQGGEPLAASIPGVAAAVSTLFGGTPANNMRYDNIGPLGGWSGNAYLANDPRLAYFMNLSSAPETGLGLNFGGYVDGEQRRMGCATGPGCGVADARRGLPLIAYRGTPEMIPADSNAGFLGEEDWGVTSFSHDDDDARSRKGFYGCCNHSGDDVSFNEASRACLLGIQNESPQPSWRSDGVNHSGRAWGFIQSILRHCTGSGDSIDPTTGSPWLTTTNANGVKCAPAFEYLENVAACLIIPRNFTERVTTRGASVLRPSGMPSEAFGGDNDPSNDFAGCHPGCLIASDADASSTAETPYRSSCINLDALRVTSYGPDIQTAMRPASWRPVPPVLPAPNDTAPMGSLVPRYAVNWMKYAASTPTARTEFPGLTLPFDPGPPPDYSSSDTTALTGGGTAAGDKAMDKFGNVIRSPGMVSERGNPSLITRLDMTDRGPLGTCQQNCLAYGYGKDRTYGEHNNQGIRGTAANPDACLARVPKEPNGTATVHCNLDYDRDGILDRKSYAIASSYREECADPHDGVAWAPAFNISSTNTALSGAGCRNALPNDAANAPPPTTLTPFCDQGGLTALQTATTSLSVGATALSTTNLAITNRLQDRANWLGGAKCHMGSTQYTTASGGNVNDNLHPHPDTMASLPPADVDAFGHPDYWIEDECPDPAVYTLNASAGVNVGKVCGCGVLIVRDTGLRFVNGSHFLWRGLIVWQLSNAWQVAHPNGADVALNVATEGVSTFAVEGGVLLTGDADFKLTINHKGDSQDATVSNDEGRFFKQLWRQNPAALAQVLGSSTSALKAVRRVR